MSKLFLFVSILFLSLAAMASEDVKEERSGDVRGFVYATGGYGDGIKAVRQKDYAYGGGILGSYALGPVSFHGMAEYSEERDAFVRYAFVDLGNGEFGVRAGRVQHLLGFYNQKRNLPCCADFITPPAAIYRETFRDLASSGDGYQVYGTATAFDWETRLQFTEAKPVLYPMADLVKGHVNSSSLGEFEDTSKVHGINLTIASPDRSVQFRYDRTFLDFDFKSKSMFLPSGPLETIVHTYGLRWYVVDSFDVTVEKIHVDQKGPVWNTLFMMSPHPKGPDGWILSARYRPTERMTINAFMDTWCTEQTDCSGEKQSASTGGTSPAHAFFIHTYGLFVGYKVDKDWSIGTQYTKGHGTETHFDSDKNSKENWSRIQFQIVRSWQ